MKYRVTAQVPGFSLDNDDFSIIVRTHLGRTVAVYSKENMLKDSCGGYIFTIPSARRGVYYAQFIAKKEDIDFDDGVQHMIDRQLLDVVGMFERHVDRPFAGLTEHMLIAYQRTIVTNISEGSYLADIDGNPILDADGNKIYLADTSEESRTRLSMTGQELQHLLEGRTPDGTINTVPEVMDALGGVGDDTELSVMTDTDTQDMMDRILKKQ